MREIQYQDVVTAIKNMIIHCGTVLPDDAYKAIKDAHDAEKSPVAKEVLAQLLENADIAKDEKRPLCKDTGLAVFYVNDGADSKIIGGLIRDAINDGKE